MKSENLPQQKTPQSQKKIKKILGIEFAPVDVPLQRRRQTVGVLLWCLICSLIPFGFLIFLVLLYFNYTIAILYVCWIWFDRETRNTGGRRIESFRRWGLWNLYADYFPLKLVKTAELDPKKNYLMGAHPHGVFCIGAFGSFATEALGFSKLFPKMTPYLLTVDKSFWLPFTRELLLTIDILMVNENDDTGALPATKESMSYLLRHSEGGKVAVLLPGGVPEQLESRSHTDLVKLRDRKGFIKLALQCGSPLVPAYSFGENDAYDQYLNEEGTFFRRVQLAFIKAIGFYMPFVNGRGLLQYSYGFLPKRIPITTVVGAPIEVQKSSHPTEAEITALHNKFISELKDLFYTHRGTCGYPDAQLEFL